MDWSATGESSFNFFAATPLELFTILEPEWCSITKMWSPHYPVQRTRLFPIISLCATYLDVLYESLLSVACFKHKVNRVKSFLLKTSVWKPIRDEICQCRHCRQQCNIFASGVNFSRNNAIYNINESTKYFLLISFLKLLTYYLLAHL